jgi:hypothetical protein
MLPIVSSSTTDEEAIATTREGGVDLPMLDRQ